MFIEYVPIREDVTPAGNRRQAKECKELLRISKALKGRYK
jgi:hypothetical protein